MIQAPVTPGGGSIFRHPRGESRRSLEILRGIFLEKQTDA